MLMIDAFFQQKQVQLGLDIDLERNLLGILKQNSYTVVKRFLIRSSESWPERGQVSEDLLTRIRDKVNLSFSEYQDILEDLKNAKASKSTLKANLYRTQDNLNTHRELLEFLIDYRKPLFCDSNKEIEYYLKEKQNFNVYIENFKGDGIELKENIRKLSLKLKKLDNQIQCHQFLIKYFDVNYINKQKERCKNYSIKVISAKNKIKSEETLRIKNRITLKPQIFGFKNDIFSDQTTLLLESPISSNHSRDSYRSE